MNIMEKPIPTTAAVGPGPNVGMASVSRVRVNAPMATNGLAPAKTAPTMPPARNPRPALKAAGTREA